MEFNDTNKTTDNLSSTATPVVEDKVILNSPERTTIGSLPNALSVSVSNNTSDSVLVTHDSTNVQNLFTKDNIKTSLVGIYGRSGRLHLSSKTIESAEIPLSEFPVKLEYTFIVADNGNEIEYTSEVLLPSVPTNSLVTLTGKSTSSQNELTIPNAIASLDADLVKIKNNLQSFSYIYNISEKKVVSLHDYLININTKLVNLAKDIADVKEKTKDL